MVNIYPRIRTCVSRGTYEKPVAAAAAVHGKCDTSRLSANATLTVANSPSSLGTQAKLTIAHNCASGSVRAAAVILFVHDTTGRGPNLTIDVPEFKKEGL